MKNSALKIVEYRILNSNDQDKIWSYSDFADISFDSASKALSVLSKNNKIKRVQKGFYYHPKQTILGETSPDNINLIIAKLSKKIDFFCISGLNGYNNIGLTTQIPNTVTIACDYPMRSSDKVKFIRRKKPHSATAIERIVLDAINDIENIPGTTVDKVLLKIKELIKADKVSINDLSISALKEPPRIRAIVGALSQELGINNRAVKNLKTSLNPSTTFSLKTCVLKYAKEWKIKSK